jgi:hypothetical protein
MADDPTTPISPYSKIARQLYPGNDTSAPDAPKIGGENDPSQEPLAYTLRRQSLAPDSLSFLNGSQAVALYGTQSNTPFYQPPSRTESLHELYANRVKVRDDNEANMVQDFGHDLLAQYYRVPKEKIAANPELYWRGFAKVAQDDTQGDEKYLGGTDPLSTDPGLRKLLLENSALFTRRGGVNLAGMLGQGNRLNFTDGKHHASVVVFDSPNRPEDKGVAGTSYGGEAYVITTDADGRTVARGPYKVSTYANSVSNSDNSPATAEIMTKGISIGGIDYNNAYGHHAGQPNQKRGLNMGSHAFDGQEMQFYREVESTGPNPVRHPPYGLTPDQGMDHYVEAGNFHPGMSDLGNYSSRGSQACFTILPEDASRFLGNFRWNGPSSITGTSVGRVYAYRGDNTESLAMRKWVTSLHPTR